MDEQIRNVVGLIVLGALGGLGTYLSRRQFRKAGVGANHAEIVGNLRDAVAGWREKYDLAEAGRMAADAKLAEQLAAQALERTLAAQCRSDLDDARSEIRELERQAERRRRPRPPTRSA